MMTQRRRWRGLRAYVPVMPPRRHMGSPSFASPFRRPASASHPAGRGVARHDRSAHDRRDRQRRHVLVHGQLHRRSYRGGAGARSLTEVVATGIKKLDPQPHHGADRAHDRPDHVAADVIALWAASARARSRASEGRR
jgi:hypothetical protein